MKSSFVLSIVSSVLLAGMNLTQAAWPDASSAVALKGSETPEQIQEAYTAAINTLAPQLGFGRNSQQALRKFEATVHHAARLGAEAERAACCNAVATALQGDAPVDAKYWMLKLIQFTGKAEIVPAEAKLLDGPEPLIREMARAALEHNPAPEAAAALRRALTRATEPSWQAALVLALGTRKDTASVPVFIRLLQQNDEAVVGAALFALGNIANSQAQLALASAVTTVPEPLRAAAAEAYIKCLEQTVKAGQGAAVQTAYRRLYQQTKLPRPVRLAALEGILKSSGDAAANQILEILAGEDADARAVALGFIPDLSGGGLKILAAGLGKLPTATQTLLLGLLAEHGEKSALPAALSFAQSKEEDTRLAGLSALGQLGDASSVPVLVEMMQVGGNAAGAARQSLTRLSGSGVNEAIITAMQHETAPGRRAALIEVLENRGARDAVPVLLAEVTSDNAGLRRPAMRALGRLAQPANLPAMLQGLLKTAPGSERNDAEKAIATVCERVADPNRQTDATLAFYRTASPAEQLVLLPLLGRLGGPKALEAVKIALASSDAATSKAGLDALANWPDASETVEEELLRLTRQAQNPGDRATALRAYVRAITLPSGASDKERLQKFEKAMSIAQSDQERDAVLERVAEVRSIDTLRFVVPFLDNPALVPKAGTAVVELAKQRPLRERNPAEFEQALNKIVAVCKDRQLVERAKRRLAEK